MLREPAGKDACATEVAGRMSRLSLTVFNLSWKVIEKTGFLSYFLIVGDFIRYGHEKGSPAWRAVRPPDPSSLYLLEFQTLTAIRYGLLFRTFSHPERINPPDYRHRLRRRSPR